MTAAPIPVSARVFAGLETIRRSGVTNMFDRPRVLALAERLGYGETAAWLRAHPAWYAHGLFHGFTVIDAEDTPCADSPV